VRLSVCHLKTYTSVRNRTLGESIIEYPPFFLLLKIEHAIGKPPRDLCITERSRRATTEIEVPSMPALGCG
jgi:hypothetical protein